ncbi:MAG: DUF4389 domain-containing protein [bacterium]
MQEQILGAVQNPVQVIITRPEKSSRWLALATLLFFIPKGIILIPHFFVLYFLGIASLLVGIVAQVIVLFAGSYPAGIHNFVSAILRWQVRVNAYTFGLVDKYPPFTLNE